MNTAILIVIISVGLFIVVQIFTKVTRKIKSKKHPQVLGKKSDFK
jgi:hypothetical protein